MKEAGLKRGQAGRKGLTEHYRGLYW
jgi:hypothetical protein